MSPTKTSRDRPGKTRRAVVTPLPAVSAPVADDEESRDAPEDEPRWPWSRFLRPKGNLEREHLVVLSALALIPLLSVLVRILALPGVLDPSFGAGLLDPVRSLGTTLSQTLSLSSVPPDQRNRILYLLFLPTNALLVVFVGLTLGIRVLGFRSILLSVGFQHCGVIPSLVLIAVIVAVIASLRPHLKKLQLRRTARISVILGIVVITMIVILLLSPWLRSETMWRAAFFPVIMLGLLSEGIAKTLDRDNAFTASWRAGSTIVLAFLIGMLFHWPPLRELVLEFPELVGPEIVAIILVSEFLELRLFQDWDAKLAGMAPPHLFSETGRYRVAVVRNRDTEGILGRLGRATPTRFTRRTVQRLLDALRDAGHTVRVVEGDMNLFRELREFMPSHGWTGQPGGIVLNLAHGIQGHDRSAHVPAMLELAGVPYTGPTPRGVILSQDVPATRALLQRAGVPTPAFEVTSGPADASWANLSALRLPLRVRPRHDPIYRDRIVHDPSRLERAVADVVRRFGQEAVVEEHVVGRDMRVALLGNDPLDCFPTVEVLPDRSRVCPAPIGEGLGRRVRGCAEAAFRACGCRDFARVDIRVDESGRPWVLAVRSVGILARSGVFAQAAAEAGYEFGDLLCRIVDVARARYASGRGVPRPDIVPEQEAFPAPVRKRPTRASRE